MHLFPVFLQLAGRPCVIVGAGAVGVAKAEALTLAGAHVTVIEPEPSPALQRLAENTATLSIRARRFLRGDTKGALLVFACTNEPSAQDEVADDAANSGALLCRVDEGQAGDFTSAATLFRGPVCVAVSSGGASPALAMLARDRIAEAIGEEYALAAELLAELRGRLRSVAASQSQRASAMRWILGRGLLELTAQGRSAEIDSLVAEAVERAARVPAEAAEVDPCIA